MPTGARSPPIRGQPRRCNERAVDGEVGCCWSGGPSRGPQPAPIQMGATASRRRGIPFVRTGGPGGRKAVRSAVSVVGREGVLLRVRRSATCSCGGLASPCGHVVRAPRPNGYSTPAHLRVEPSSSFVEHLRSFAFPQHTHVGVWVSPVMYVVTFPAHSTHTRDTHALRTAAAGLNCRGGGGDRLPIRAVHVVDEMRSR